MDEEPPEPGGDDEEELPDLDLADPLKREEEMPGLDPVLPPPSD
jgi:hypothetical protein